MNIIELTTEETSKYLKNFYNYFKTPYDFEEFLKPFLEKFKYDEVVVTQRSRDGGIDLKAKKTGNFENDNDTVIIQAKLYKPGSTIGREVVDKLLGIMHSGEKGIIITTGKFSKEAKKAVTRKPENPIDLIDGEKLISLCIEKNIGFVFKPVFSPDKINDFLEDNKEQEVNVNNTKSLGKPLVKKMITSNDIRARIIRIPKPILANFPNDKNEFNIIFNDNKLNNIKINATREYFSSRMTEMYKKYELITKDNVYVPCESLWSIDGDTIIIKLSK